MGRSSYYFPYIEATLDKYELPLELKYMTVIESGLNPMAHSKSGALGIWQFKYNSALLFDLEITSYIDERCDLHKSTDAACRYLEYLYRTFNDWNLVLAAYNGGPGEVRKAIERSGGKTDFWELHPYLSEQAANYIPLFIAVYYLFEHTKEYGLHVIEPKWNYNDIDTVHVRKPVTFEQLSSFLHIEEQELKWFNPMYKHNFIPATPNAKTLVLPKNKIRSFILYEDDIAEQETPRKDYNYLSSQAGLTSNLHRIEHIVQKGEFYHKIAIKYCCTVENIRAWNNLNDEPLYTGQKLILWVKPEENDN